MCKKWSQRVCSVIRLNPPPQVLRHYKKHSWDGTEAWKLSHVSGAGFWKGKGKSTSFRSRNSYILASFPGLPNVLVFRNLQYTKTKGGGLVYHINDVMTHFAHAFFAPIDIHMIK